MVVAMHAPIPARIGKVMVPKGYALSLKNPFKGVGDARNLLESIPILVKTSQNMMSVEFPLSIRIHPVV